MHAWGGGHASREFLYEEDAAQAIVLAAAPDDDPAPVNLGSGQELSLRALAALIAELTGFTGRLVWDATTPEGHPRRGLETSLAEHALGFRAQTDFREGLQRTIAWSRQRHALTP